MVNLDKIMASQYSDPTINPMSYESYIKRLEQNNTKQYLSRLLEFNRLILSDDQIIMYYNFLKDIEKDTPISQLPLINSYWIDAQTEVQIESLSFDIVWFFENSSERYKKNKDMWSESERLLRILKRLNLIN